MRHVFFRPLALALTLLATVPAIEALACGGCFSPPTPTIDQTVRQDAERVLFVRDPVTKVSTVWVEVRYTGLAKDFGWVLPVPKLPKVGVGSVTVFDALDQSMQARVFRTVIGAENCRDPALGCDHFDYPPYDALSDASMGADSAGGGGPNVEILASGQTGPYNYQVVKGSDSAVLYKWLVDNGYEMPASAKPILQTHVDKGDLFVVVKLQNGKGIEAIRPITLEMDDAEPCVPLRLTSIAAVDDMSVIVTVAGPGRAIVKNHLDVTIDPLLLAIPFGYGAVVPTNYQQVVAAAIDEASGHAFVTEYAQAGKATLLDSPYKNFSYAPMATAKTLLDLAMLLAGGLLPVTAEVAEAFEPMLHLTEAFPGVAPLQTLANLRACGQYWQGPGGFYNPTCFLPTGPLTKAQLSAVAIDGVALADEVTATFTVPLAEMAQKLAASQTVPRLDMRISPAEMDRDPVFAYNPALPDVEPLIPVTLNQVCPTGWVGDVPEVRLSVEGLGSWVHLANPPVDGRFLSLPAAWHMQVLDETGQATEIDPKQAPIVAAAILGAKPGKPSLAADLVLTTPAPWLPPESDPLVTTLGPWHKPLYCVAKAYWVDGQLPPTGQGQPDATSGDTLPGVDAIGGWKDVGELTDVAATSDAVPVKNGCTAGRAAFPGWLALVLAVGAVLRRRVVSRREN